MKIFIPLLLLLTALLMGCGNDTANRVENANLQTNTEQTKTPADINNDPDAYYRYLIATHGENYEECIQPIEIQLKELQPPDGAANEGKQAELNVVVALDASGSMAGQIGGEKKIDAARRAIANFVETLPPETNVALVVYGHKGSSRAADKSASCAGVETIYPVERLNREQFTEAVNSFQPAGYTPIAAAIEQSGSRLSAFTGEQNRNVIYVVTDGIETCGGDPVSAARLLHSSNTRAVVNIIGFDVDNQAQQQLRAAAEAGGGAFYLARDNAELTKAFEDSAKEVRRFVENVSTNLENRNEVMGKMIAASNELHNCTLSKLHRETNNVQKALSAIPYGDPKFKFKIEVSRRHYSERRDFVENWLKDLKREIKDLRTAEMRKLLDQLTTLKSDRQD